ncbi:MAG: amino acid racemase [Clostridiales bacterium]|nr:amino acid racemase [Clostridiales bacterium]
MKKIGLIGGLSWQSSLDYYRIINELVAKRLGGQHSAVCIMYSVDLDPILIYRDSGEWHKNTEILADAISKVEAAGADFTLICSNTMHKTYEDIQVLVKKPILHITDVLAKEIKKRGYQKVGLLGTRFTLNESFYKERLRLLHNIEAIIPKREEDVQFVHDVIYYELDYAIIKPKSRDRYVRIIEDMWQEGAEAVILGCTEIQMLVQQEHTKVPLLDSTLLHATAAVDLALGE